MRRARARARTPTTGRLSPPAAAALVNVQDRPPALSCLPYLPTPLQPRCLSTTLSCHAHHTRPLLAMIQAQTPPAPRRLRSVKTLVERLDLESTGNHKGCAGRSASGHRSIARWIGSSAAQNYGCPQSSRYDPPPRRGGRGRQHRSRRRRQAAQSDSSDRCGRIDEQLTKSCARSM
jgi:hypothetical protein